MNADIETPPTDLYEDEVRGNFFTRLLWTFISPTKLYHDIEGKPFWWQPWVWASIIGIIGAYLYYPIQFALLELNPQGLPPDKLEQAVDMMRRFYFVGYITVPIFILLQGLIFSLIGYIAAAVLVSGVNFKKYFTLFLYSNIVVGIGSVISVLLVRQRGLENIKSKSDATVSFGLEFLVPEGHKLLDALATSVNVFSLWAYVLIAMGLVQIFHLTKRQAVAAVVPIWLVYAVFFMIGAMMSKAF